MPLTVMLAAPENAALVQALSAAAYIPVYQAVIGVVPKPATEDYAARIARGEVWLAYVDGTAVGVLVLEPMPDTLTVYSVAVDPQHQGQGYASALLAHAEATARARGCKAVSLYTNKRMARNVALYRRNGYAVIGERPHPSRPGEILLDLIKPLRDALR